MCYALRLVKVSTVTLMIIFITTVKCQGEQQQSWRNNQMSPFLYKLLNGMQNENTLYEYNPQEIKDDGAFGQENLDVFSRGASANKQDKSPIKSAVAPGDVISLREVCTAPYTKQDLGSSPKSTKTSSLQSQAPGSGAATPATPAPSPNAPSAAPSAGSAPPAAPSASSAATSSTPPSSASQTLPKGGAPSGSKALEPPAQVQGNDDPKVHELAKLVEQLYVAQAQVQLEASEIQKAQAVAATAQQALEEAANNVRIITEALHTAQQEVATAAIRAQTAQLQLAAHDQLLFAARQRVDALSSQMVGLQAEAGIRPCKVVVDMQDLSNKLKQPLPDSQKPTPIPSILGNVGADTKKASLREDTKDKKFGWNCAKARETGPFMGQEAPNNLPEKSKNDQSLRYILSHGQDLIKYNDLILQDSGAPAAKENNQGKRSSDDKSLNHENEGLSERDLKDLYNFIQATDSMQNLSHYEENVNQNQNDNDQSQASQLQDFGILRPALQKSSDRKYIDDFLNKIRNSQKREDKNSEDTQHEKPQEKKLSYRDPNINEYIVNFETKRLSRENSRASQRKKNFAERLTNTKDNSNFNFNKDF